MNKRQIPIATAIIHAADYIDTLLPDITHTPPTKVDLKFAAIRADLRQISTDLGGKQILQTGGTFHQETATQSSLRDQLEDELGDVNLTASTIAAAAKTPAIMARFRMPDGRSDNSLANTALAMAAAIRELALNDEFESHGYPADTAAHLETLVADFKDSEGSQGSTLGHQAGATAAIPGLLRQGKTALKVLTSIFNRIYKGNEEILTAWETASHIEKTNPRPAPVPTPPAP